MQVRGGATRSIAASWRWRALVRYGVAVAVLVTLAVLSYRLMLAPIHATHDAAGCARAYAEARTRGDTLSVDFLSYPDPAGRPVNRRCGALRTATVDLNRR